MSRITEVEQILDTVLILDVRAIWRESAYIMSQIQKQLPSGPQEWPFLSKEYAPEAYVAVIMLNNCESFEDMFRAMDNRLCYYLKECIRVAQDKVLRYGETLSSEDIVEWALRDKWGKPPLDNYRQVRSFVWVRAALRALDRCLDFLNTKARGASSSPTKQTEEPAAARDELFQAFDVLCKDEKKRYEIMQYLPGRQGRKKKGVQTKVEYMNDLRKEICPALSSTEYFMKRFDDWARERLSQKTDKENG